VEKLLLDLFLASLIIKKIKKEKLGHALKKFMNSPDIWSSQSISSEPCLSFVSYHGFSSNFDVAIILWML
jgi:hypothetical protein